MTLKSCAKPPTIAPKHVRFAMHRMTKKERRHVVGRMGRQLFTRRLHLEDTRELKLGGRIRLCPMRLFKGVLTAAFKLSGLWRNGYRAFLDPIVRETEFLIDGLDPRLDGLAILHLSDLHLDLDTALTPVLAERIKDLRYDLAVVTGDFNNFTIHMDGAALDEMRALMPAFTAPVYGVLGNHDSVRDIPALEAMGVRMLINESVALAHNGVPFVLAGIDDPNIFRTHDLAKALPQNSIAALTLLLTHSPCIHREAAQQRVDIVLAGHTHGGQICLPGGRMLAMRVDRGSAHVRKGYWKEGRTQGWTSSGTGACGIPIRLNCPSEILIHRIRKGRANVEP